MRTLTAGILALVLLPITACTDSAIDTPVDSADSVSPSDNAVGESSLASVPSPPTTTEDGHDEHSSQASHAPHESHTTASRQRHGHGHEDRQQSAAGIEIGQVVPDFEVTIDGMSRKLSELQKDSTLTQDGTIAFTFWCSFCHSCRDVEADLDKLAATYQGRVGIIALDASAGETAEAVAEFAAKKKLSMPIALDAQAATADLFGIRTTTTTVVIDSKRVLRYCGRFSDDQHSYAENAIVAVLAGSDVVVKQTAHRG